MCSMLMLMSMECGSATDAVSTADFLPPKNCFWYSMSSASVSNTGFGVMTLDVCRPTPLSSC